MSKRGRPRTFPGKMDTTIGVRVPTDLADELYRLVQRESFDVCAETRAYWQRVIKSRRFSLSENRQSNEKDAVLLT